MTLPAAAGRIRGANVIFDANGNLYGTTSSGGNTGVNCFPGGCGVVWEITP